MGPMHAHFSLPGPDSLCVNFHTVMCVQLSIEGGNYSIKPVQFTLSLYSKRFEIV